MILLHGLHQDPPIARVIEALDERGQSYALLDPATLHIDGLSADDSRLRIAGTDWPADAVRAVYSRPLAPPQQSQAPDAVQRGLQQHERLVHWLDRAPGLVINRPSAMLSNGSKPLQIQLIAACGFEVPETLVTSDEDEARAFWAEHGRVVFKSISGVRSIVRELDEARARQLLRLRHLPVQFQAWVPGRDLRVHVVGERCHATIIDSEQPDYRYPGSAGDTRMAPWTLDDGLAERCVHLAQALDLALAGIDLRLRPDGAAVCFEVNPMPAYSHFEHHTGQPIAADIARLLCEVAA